MCDKTHRGFQFWPAHAPLLPFWNAQAAISPTEHFLQIKQLIVRVSKLTGCSLSPFLCHSRTCLQLPTALSCLTTGPPRQAHSQPTSQPGLSLSPSPLRCLVLPSCPALGVALPGGPPGAPGSDCEQKTEGNFMRRHFTKAVHLNWWNTPFKVSYLELHIALHKSMQHPD